MGTVMPVTDSATPQPPLWIEVLSRDRVISRHRCAGRSVRIGRGYDCDLILDDPHVAARHAQLTLEPDGRIVIDDLGSLNGLHTRHSGPHQHRLYLLPGEPVCVGDTWLRACTQALRVNPEQLLQPSRPIWPWTAGVIVALGGMTVGELMLLSAGTIEAGDAVQKAAYALIGFLGWAGAWAVLTRAFSGYARLGTHLLIANGTALLLSVLADLNGLISYSLSLPRLLEAGAALNYLFMGAALYAHLRVVSPAHARLKAAAVAGLVLMLAGFKLRDHLDPSIGHPALLTDLQPPALRLVAPESGDAYFAAAAALQSELDHGRTVEEVSKRNSALFDDD